MILYSISNTMLILSLLSQQAGSASVCIGAVLMNTGDEHVTYALQYAQSLLHKTYGHELMHLTVEMQYIHKPGAYELRKRVCYLVEQGAIGLVGSSDPELDRQTTVLCNELNIPYFSIVTGGFGSREPSASGMSIRLFPRLQILDAIEDMITFWEWKHVSLVYKEDRRIIDLSKLVEAYSLRNVRFRILKIDNDSPEEFLKASKTLTALDNVCSGYSQSMRESCSPENHRIVLDLNPTDIHNFLLAALKVGQINTRNWYILTSTDMHHTNLDWFRHNRGRITGFDLRDLKSNLPVQELVETVKRYWMKDHPNSLYFPLTETLLAFDSVISFGNAYMQLRSERLVEKDSATWVRCNQLNSYQPIARPSPTAHTLFNHIQYGNGILGVTGNLSFFYGNRPNMTLNIYQMGFSGNIERIGSWNGANRNKAMNVNETIRKALNVTDKTKPHFVVTTILEHPYVKCKRRGLIEVGTVQNKRDYEGFCIDLLTKLSEDLSFSYDLRIVEDGKYGASDDNGVWNGMVGEVISGKADMAVAPLTMNYKRSHAVDFTQPFLSLGISILFRIPTDQKPGLFSFMNPLARSIWLYLAVAIVCIILCMYVIARLTPYEWNPVRHSCGGFRRSNNGACSAHGSLRDLTDTNPTDKTSKQQSGSSRSFGYHPKATCYAPSPMIPAPAPPRPIELINNYSFFNTVWYVASTLMKGGCDFGPKAMSTRLLGGMWWVFTLVLVSAYTANLAAVLTVDKYYLPIKNMEELANQTDISYGSVYEGSTMQFFQESKIEHHQRMWRRMNASLNRDPVNSSSVFVKSNKDGVARVLRHNYAYLMESSSLEYEVIQNCNLTQIGGVLGSRGYGIAFPKGNEWTDLFSRHILIYGKKGTLEMLKKRWFDKSSSCTSVKEYRRALNMDNVAGLFLVLLGGMLLAVISVITEFCIRSKHNASEDKEPICKEMADELCFAIRLTPSKKKHNMARRCDHCESTNNLQMSPHVPTHGAAHIHDDVQSEILPISPLEQLNGKTNANYDTRYTSYPCLRETTT